jgi:S-formylglutathione hydrolase
MLRHRRGMAVQPVLNILFCVSSLAFLNAQALPANGQRHGTLENLQVHSNALEHNKLGDSAEQPVAVYLPPSYKASPTRRYPALYLLHGFDSNIRSWTSHGYQEMNLQDSMDALIEAGTVREMIVVVPNGRNAYLGSYYTNSKVTGKWEDFILLDLVSYVDNHYRTVARAESRGVAGHSMGGFAAIMMGMKHPGIFGAVYAMSPCCLAMEADLTSINPAWHTALAAKSKGGKEQFANDPQSLEQFWVDVFLSLAAALSPNPEQGPFFVDLPYRDQNGNLVQDEPAWTEWHEKMPLEIVSNYGTNLLQLRGLFIDYGLEDDFTHIPVTARLFSEKLDRLGVPHIVASYRGDHSDHIRERLETSALPFFSRVLVREKDETKPDKTH